MKENKAGTGPQISNTVIDAKTFAEAIKLLMNPATQTRDEATTYQPGKEQKRVRCISPTGARFICVIEVNHNKVGGKLEPVIQTFEDYEYPYSALIEAVAPRYRPALKYWKSPKPYRWRDNPNTDKLAHPLTGQLLNHAAQMLYEDTFRADINAFVGCTVEEGGERGLKVDRDQPEDMQPKSYMTATQLIQ